MDDTTGGLFSLIDPPALHLSCFSCCLRKGVDGLTEKVTLESGDSNDSLFTEHVSFASSESDNFL